MALFSSGFWVGCIIGFGCGGSIVWFCKNALLSLVMDANTLSAKLHAQANAITAAAKKL